MVPNTFLPRPQQVFTTSPRLIESFNHFQIKTFLQLALLSLFPLLFFFDPFLIFVLNHSASSCCKNKILPRHAKTKAQISCAVYAQLISTFVFRYTDGTIPLLSLSKISSPFLYSMAVRSGLCQINSGTPKTGFLMTGLINTL